MPTPLLPLQLSLELTLIALLLVACGYDLAQRRIPNRLLACGLLCTLALHLVAAVPMALLHTVLAGLLTGLLMFLPLYIVRAMAAGDVKLMATVGAFCGPLMTFQIGLATYCCGGVLALVIILWRRKAGAAAVNVRALLQHLLLRMSGVPLVAQPLPTPSVGGMPYALAIALGSFLMLAMRHI